MCQDSLMHFIKKLYFLCIIIDVEHLSTKVSFICDQRLMEQGKAASGKESVYFQKDRSFLKYQPNIDILFEWCVPIVQKTEWDAKLIWDAASPYQRWALLTHSLTS